MARKAPAKLSPKLEDELRDRLEDLLDEQDDVSEKRRRLSKLLGGHLKVLGETVSITRRQLKGLNLDQLEIPGTEVPAPARDPLVQDILRIAGGIVERQKDDEAREEGGVKEPEPLVWKQEAKNLVAMLSSDGTYIVEPGFDGDNFHAFWQPTDGRPKNLGLHLGRPAAKEVCRVHHVERFADGLLKAAGAGDMTTADLKGKAERFKKGG